MSDRDSSLGEKLTTDGTKLGAGLVAASGRKAMMRRGALTHGAGGAQGSRLRRGFQNRGWEKAGWEGFSSLIPEIAATASEEQGNAEEYCALW